MSIGIFGGTFDPIHIGHLRTALELKNFLGLDRMLLIPSGDPPHRIKPVTPAVDRLAMVELAVKTESGLEADGREVCRDGFSYSIDTLVELRGELGSTEPICFCIGLDSLLTLHNWHRWQEILDYAHIVVAVRPGWELPIEGELSAWLDQYRTEEQERMLASAAGSVFIDEMTLLPVAATALRTALAKGESISYLTTDSVIQYIRNNQLYMSF